VFARRQIAQRCLYGVDRNPVAVDLAKVSLWLVTLAKDHALTFVDHALRHGDSLVGLSRKQIEAFHWDPSAKTFREGFGMMQVREHLAKAASLRQQIRGADEGVSDWELRDLWDEAQLEVGKVRLFGDLVLVAYFDGDKPKEREARRREFTSLVATGEAERHRGMLEELRHADPALAPFHWEIELPEVFDRENPGFDAIVGNPPFAGKNTVAAGNVARYPEWLQELHAESHGNADLVAHFFRRSFDLVRKDGAFGLIATNTISQGDTRSTGLRWICQHGGEIFNVTKRVKWPGLAAVVVSVLHVSKGPAHGPKWLDKQEVEAISAFLFHGGGSEEPARLLANSGKSFVGSIVLGMGFTFDDTDRKGVASSLADMRQLIARNVHNQEVIFPYIGGEEVNQSPSHVHHRFVVDFGERSEQECRKTWPDLLSLVEIKVKPERLENGRESYRRYWWQFGEKRNELRLAIDRISRVWALSRVGQHLAVAALPADMVYSDSLIVFPLPSCAAFCALQARPHEVWARFFGSSLEDRLRYTPSDCFETFPFPENWESHPQLEAAGRRYYEFRAQLMTQNDEGMTKTYNRFHDRSEASTGILALRELHADMDRAVLDAYGWHDIRPEAEFLLEYESDEDETGKGKKEPYRYRWNDEAQAEILARLLELNAERAKRQASTPGVAAKSGGVGKKSAKRKPSGTGDLFE